jgi:hypothetical protein
LRRMRMRPFVIEDLTEVAGIDPRAARRASVKIHSFLWRWPVLSARNVVHGRQNPRTNAEVSIARMRAAQSNASKTPGCQCAGIVDGVVSRRISGAQVR